MCRRSGQFPGKETQMALEIEHHLFCLFALSQFTEVSRDGRWRITYGRLVWVRPRHDNTGSFHSGSNGLSSVAWPKPNYRGLENVV